MIGSGSVVISQLNAAANGVLAGAGALVPAFIVVGIALLLVCEAACILERLVRSRNRQRRHPSPAGRPVVCQRAA